MDARPTCQCGCGSLTNLIDENNKTLGLVKGAYRKFVRGHTHKSKNQKSHQEGRAHEHYVENEETGCWEWAGSFGKNGYGMAYVGGKLVAMHRFSYQYHKGEIPKGLVVDHLCRNRACINPSHLEAVTQRTNSLRGAKTIWPAETIEKVKDAIANGDKTADVAQKFGMSVGYVYSVATGQRRTETNGEVKGKLAVRGRRRCKIEGEKIQEIRALRVAGMKNVEIAKMFGISEAYASQIATGALDRREYAT